MTNKGTTITIKALNYSAEEIAEVERIQTSAIHTKMKEQVRAVLGCSLCVICAEIPSKKIIYNLTGIIRTETYCDHCFSSVYERNQEPTNSEQLAAMYGCTVAKPGTFGGGKKEYEQF